MSEMSLKGTSPDKQARVDAPSSLEPTTLAVTDAARTELDESQHDTDSDDDENTLTAFGDISLSKSYLIPSLHSEITPSKHTFELWTAKKPPLPRKSGPRKVSRFLPTDLRSDLVPRPKTDFKTLVETLKNSRSRNSSGIPRHSDARPSAPALESAADAPTPKKLATPAPERPLRGSAKLPSRPPLPRWDAEP